MLYHLFKIFDRKKLFNSFEHPDGVLNIALQRGNGGTIFATACVDGILRLFDTRRDSKREFIFQSAIRLY